MTDQQMDARLREAGERWRADNPGDAAPVDLETMNELPPSRPSKRSHVLMGAAAAAVVALVVGLTLALRGSTPPAPPSVDNAGLVGNVWLVTTDGRPSTAALYISRTGVLVADDECRVIGARAKVAGARLVVTDVTVRLKPCTDQYGPGFYDKGTRVLRGPATFRIDSRGMTITHAGVGSLRFVLAQTPIPPPSPDVATLTGTDWVAPNGTVLHIDPSTGQLSGGYCGGRALLTGSAVRFTDCPAAGRATYNALVSGATLTLVAPSLAPVPATHNKLVFHWRPIDASIIDPASLTGRTWHLQSVDGSPASTGSLRITGATAVVQDGCTTYRRAVTVADGTFTIAGGAPAHACTTKAETADSFVFNDPATWTVRDGRLIVFGGGSQAFALVYGTAAPTTQQQDPALLLVHQWEVASITYGSGTYRDGAPSGDPAVLSFTGERYTLAHTCYVVTGTAQRGSDTIDFSGAQTVQHSCPAPVGSARDDAAQAIDAILSGQVQWTLDGATLTISANGGKLVLTGGGGNVRDLVDSAWHLAGAQSGSRGIPVVGDVTLRFPDDTTLSITRCYTSQASADITSDAMTLTGLHVTKALPCPSGPAGTQEQNDFIDSVLNGNVSWSIDGDRLTLTHGPNALIFTRRP